MGFFSFTFKNLHFAPKVAVFRKINPPHFIKKPSFQLYVPEGTTLNRKIISSRNSKAASSNSLFLLTKETHLCLLIIQSFRKPCCLFASSKTHRKKGKNISLLLLQVLEAKYPSAIWSFQVKWTSNLTIELDSKLNTVEHLCSKIRGLLQWRTSKKVLPSHYSKYVTIPWPEVPKTKLKLLYSC